MLLFEFQEQIILMEPGKKGQEWRLIVPVKPRCQNVFIFVGKSIFLKQGLDEKKIEKFYLTMKWKFLSEVIENFARQEKLDAVKIKSIFVRTKVFQKVFVIYFAAIKRISDQDEWIGIF